MHDELGQGSFEVVVGEGQLLGDTGPDIDPGKRSRAAATKEADGSTADTASAPSGSTSCAVSAPVRSPRQAPAAPSYFSQLSELHRQWLGEPAHEPAVPSAVTSKDTAVTLVRC